MCQTICHLKSIAPPAVLRAAQLRSCNTATDAAVGHSCHQPAQAKARRSTPERSRRCPSALLAPLPAPARAWQPARSAPAPPASRRAPGLHPGCRPWVGGPWCPMVVGATTAGLCAAVAADLAARPVPCQRPGCAPGQHPIPATGRPVARLLPLLRAVRRCPLPSGGLTRAHLSSPRPVCAARNRHLGGAAAAVRPVALPAASGRDVAALQAGGRVGCQSAGDTRGHLHIDFVS